MWNFLSLSRLVHPALLALGLVLSGCFSPSLKDGEISCGPSGGCPPGFECHSGLCYAGDPPADASVDAPIDVPPATARLTIDAMTADLGSVVIGQTSGAAMFLISNTGNATTGMLQVNVTGAGYNLVSGGCSGPLAPAATCMVSVTVLPLTSGMQAGMLVVSASPGGSVQAALTATALAAGALSISPTTHDYAGIVAGMVSGSTPFTVTNTGGSTTGAIMVSLGGTDAAQFGITSNGCTAPLAAGASCVVQVRFNPAAGTSGAMASSLTAMSSPGGATVANLMGTVLAPGAISIAPATFDFGSTVIAMMSGTMPFVVTNTGGAATGVVSVVLGGTNASEFEITTNGCTGTLAPGATCTVQARFRPTTMGSKTGTLTATASPGGSAVSNLMGTALAPGSLSISPAMFNFPATVTSMTSTTMPFVVTNTGGATTGVVSVALGGSNASEFEIVTDGCTIMLAPGASCTVQARFRPVTTGAKTATLTATGSPGGSTVSNLSGTGLAPAGLSISPTSFDFGVVVALATSSTIPFTVTNTGGVPTGVVSATLGGVNSSEYVVVSNGCTSTLAAGGNCVVQIRFSPAMGSTGSKVAMLTATASPGSTVVANLTGTAQSPAALALGGSGAFGNVVIGQSSTLPLTVTNNGQQSSGVLTIANPTNAAFTILTGLASDCVTGVTILAGSGSCTIRVRFTPTAPGSVGASLTVSASPGGSQTGSLSGNGQRPATLQGTPASALFGDIEVGVASATTVTWFITNTGDIASTMPSLAITSNELEVSGNTCTTALPAGGVCSMTFAFRPSTGGARSSTATLSVTGSSAMFIVNATGAWRITVTGFGNGTLTSNPVGMSCSGSTCLYAPGNVTLSASTTNGSGFFFAGWGGTSAGTCAGLPRRDCTIAVDSHEEITVEFLPIDANLAFISSSTHATNLGGVAPYDAICNNLATVAGINNMTGNAFMAWMSSSTSNAVTRMGGGSGWRRVDGRVFAVSLNSLLVTQAILNPVRFTEMGAESGDQFVITGTSPTGSTAFTCNDWTTVNSTVNLTLGNTMGGVGSWVGNTGGGCSIPGRLICMGKPLTAAPSVSTFPGKKVWLTNTVYTPATGGSPDTTCNTERPAGVTTGRALIATTTTTASSLLTGTTMYVRPDGQEVGTGLEISSGNNRAGIWQQGDGSYPATNSRVWTGSPSPTMTGSTASTCGNWVDQTQINGQIGYLERSRSLFWNFAPVPCNSTGGAAARLYCYEP